MLLSRRRFLETSAAVTAGFFGLREVLAANAFAAEGRGRAAAGYGPLVTDPKGILDLPDGFTYRIIGRRGQRMDDGLVLPGSPDGMATFAGPDGLTLIVRNHEVDAGSRRGAFGKRNELLGQVDARELYDPGRAKTPAGGGTTTIVYDTKRQKVVRQFLSLAGTLRNCAGGPTPWNSWISCEETVLRMGVDLKSGRICERDHGWCFEVPARPEIGLADPVPLKAMGRFNHEAVAVDPESGVVYQTEDRDDGALYRFIPDRPGTLAAGGKLQALKISGHSSADTRNWKTRTVPVGDSLPVEWIDVDDIESPRDDLRHRSFAAGAARFARGEGMWHGRDGIYFACTSGGANKKGQIWRYVPSPYEGEPQESKAPGRLELFVEPNDSALVENADNLTVSPWGDLIVCEDRSGSEIRLIGVTPAGGLYTFAHNHQRTEFAGATFSPDGTTLFVNIQGKGLTVAITGPWQA